MDPGLYAAACAGNIDKIMKFKDKILNQVTEDTHQTVLHLAALSNTSKCVDAILEKFPSLLDKVNSRNETALHLAAGKGYTYVVKVLLNKAINGLDSDEISCPRFDFIRKGNVELDTALHLAVRNNHYDVVKAIVEADPDDEHSQNLKSETPLYLAAFIKFNSIIVEILFNCGNASVDGPEGRTALHAAVISRNPYSIFHILPRRPDILERCDNKGWTAFHYAASLNSVNELDALIEWGNPDTVVAVMGKTSHDSKKTTAHHIAAEKGHIYILTQLLEYCPAAYKVVDEDRRNILHISAEKGHKRLIRSILKDFPDVAYKLLNMQDKNGDTPLHLLVNAGCYVPELIRNKYVDRDIRNSDGLTPYQLSCRDENIVADQLMIKNALEDTQVSYLHKVVMKLGWLQKLNLWLIKIKSKNRRRKQKHHEGEA